MKKCTKCGETKPLDEFHTDRATKDGKAYSCKCCRNARQKVSYKDNREKILKWNKDYRESNIEKIAASKKAYREANIEQIRLRDKAYREANKDRISKYSRAHYKANKDYYKSYSKLYLQTEAGRDASVKASHKRRARLANVPSDNWTRSDVFTGHCWYCGTDVTLEDMHADHFVPLAKGGSNTRDNIVCSCANCNLRKSDKLPYDFIRENINDA